MLHARDFAASRTSSLLVIILAVSWNICPSSLALRALTLKTAVMAGLIKVN